MTMPPDQACREAFAARWGHPPAALVRAPGRVNLIGEHTDYSHLPVLPIAIERALFIAVSPVADDVVESTSSSFEGVVRLERKAIDDGRSPSWGQYLAGALREVAEVAPGQGARLHISGDLPAAGGLSSSSALTVGVLSALDAAWAGHLDREEILRRAVVAERHAGVESGGMDQTVILLAQRGNALRIDFNPPAHHHVPIPEGLAFVVAASGDDAPKGGAVRAAYNERVVGARIAAVMLADQVGIDVSAPPVLCDVAAVDVVDILVEDLPEKISAVEVARSVGSDIEHIVRLTASRFDHMARVPVRRVAAHILSEANRVERAEAALLAADLAGFGTLLNASHDSLRQDFRCSTPALDRVCAAMRKAGAFGARLTGAGFGGYALAAVSPDRVASVIEAAMRVTGGPAFEVHASDGLRLL